MDESNIFGVRPAVHKHHSYFCDGFLFWRRARVTGIISGARTPLIPLSRVRKHPGALSHGRSTVADSSYRLESKLKFLGSAKRIGFCSLNCNQSLGGAVHRVLGSWKLISNSLAIVIAAVELSIPTGILTRSRFLLGFCTFVSRCHLGTLLSR